MRENDFIREKNNKEFQRRVLNALEKPNTSTFLRIINSASFLWLLSALFIAAGGGYLSIARQCTDIANRTASSYRFYRDEIWHRNEQVTKIIEETTSVHELANRFRDIQPKFSSFARYKIAELRIHRSQMETLIEADQLAERKASDEKWTLELAQLGIESRQLDKLFAALDDGITHGLSDEDLVSLKALTSFVVNFPHFSPGADEFTSRCGPADVFRREILGHKIPLLKRSPALIPSDAANHSL